MFELLLRSSSLFETKISLNIVGSLLSKTQLKQVEELANTKHFQFFIEQIEGSEDRWQQFLTHPSAESVMPELPMAE